MGKLYPYKLVSHFQLLQHLSHLEHFCSSSQSQKFQTIPIVKLIQSKRKLFFTQPSLCSTSFKKEWYSFKNYFQILNLSFFCDDSLWVYFRKEIYVKGGLIEHYLNSRSLKLENVDDKKLESRKIIHQQ